MNETTIQIRDYGYQGEAENDIARVTAVYKERYELVCASGTVYGFLKPGEYRCGRQAYPTTGDFVRLEYNPSGDSRILETLPRRSLFARREPGGHAREQAVAANFDYALIVTALNRDFNPRRLERYLAVAWDSGAQPVILLTKADLYPDFGAHICAVENIAPGVPVHAVSTYTGLGMEALAAYARPGVTLVLLGSSGVGKSSLLNAMAGETLMPVNATRNVDASKGRHTTTHRQLFLLPCGAMIIDTPGMRELGMWCVEEGVADAFQDIEEILARGCRFSDCQHNREPGCAIRAALDSGELSVPRWNSYQSLRQETHFAMNRQAALRKKQAKNKEIAKAIREIHKKD